MPALTLEALSFVATLKAESVPVPEFGEGLEAWIAELSADERDSRMEVSWNEHKKHRGNDSQVGVRAWAVAACLCNGPERKFLAETPEAIADLAAVIGPHSGVPVTRMFAKVQEVNAIGEEQLEELEKN